MDRFLHAVRGDALSGLTTNGEWIVFGHQGCAFRCGIVPLRGWTPRRGVRGITRRGAFALNRHGPMATNRHCEPRQRAVVTTMRRVNDVG